MIANVSPSSKSYDDTQNTLKYANRAKEIKSTVRNILILYFDLQFIKCKNSEENTYVSVSSSFFVL